MRILLLTIFTIAGLALFRGEASAAGLEAEAEWRYGRYESLAGGETTFKASHFTQQYSLLYNRKGKINSGRGGAYDLSLGGEWTDISSDMDGEDVDLDSTKLLYQGELLLAPGGLPFRLHLFSKDMHRTALLTGYTPDVGGGMVSPDIIDNFSNGQHVETGVTLLLGIRNGSYLGRYREMLANFPRVLIDYRQTSVRNMKAREPQHFRMRDLAFVSLNKKDNWFHYRVRDYADFLNASENFLDKSYTLGTIDHTLKRQWINFTNWIRVSADGTYMVANPARTDVPVERTYNLNMFAVASRRDWGASTFATATRRTTENVLDRKVSLPVYGHGRLSRDTSWRAAFSTANSIFDHFDDGTRDVKDVVFSSLQVDSWKTRAYRLTTTLKGEVKNDRGRKSSTNFLGGELYRNVRSPGDMELYGRYSLARYADEGEEDSFEHNGTLSVARDFGPLGRFELKQVLLHATGPLDAEVSSNIQPGGIEGLEGGDTGVESRTGKVWHATSTLDWELLSVRRMDNRLRLVYDYLREGQESSDQIILSHRLQYDRQALRANVESEWVRGDDVGGISGFTSQDLNLGDLGGGKERFMNNSSLSFSRGRQWEVAGRLTYQLARRSSGSSTGLKLAQEYSYNIYTTRGLTRKLATLYEELAYEQVRGFAGDKQWVTDFTLGGAYFPLRVLELGANVRYRAFGQGAHDDNLRYTLLARWDFQKLKVEMDYAYATALGVDVDRSEHRWEVKVKKIF